MDSEPAESDTVPSTDSDPFLFDSDDIFSPIEGVIVDRASFAWHHIVAQEVWCVLLQVHADRAGFDVWMVGMEDGTTHDLATGVRLPQGHEIAFDQAGSRLASDGAVLYLTNFGSTFRVDLNAGSLHVAPVGGWWIGRTNRGLLLANLNGEVNEYASWSRLEQGVVRSSWSRRVGLLAAEGEHVYDHDGTTLRERLPRTGEIVSTWPLGARARVDRMAVVSGLQVVYMDDTVPALDLWSVATGASVREVALPLGWWVGPACGTPGTPPP